MRTVQELQAIAASGAGFTVDASRFSVEDLGEISSSAKRSGARFAILNASHLSTQDLQLIGASGGGNVVFTDL